MQVGDIVSRNSYKDDILFRIVDIRGDNAMLQGVYYRLSADSPLSDLSIVYFRHEEDWSQKGMDNRSNLFKKWYVNQTTSYKKTISDDVNEINKAYKRYGRILHIDGDDSYLKESLKLYKKLDIPVTALAIQESKQPKYILELLLEYKPNILVITGHDSMNNSNNYNENISNYKNSKYFIETVKIARQYNNNYDDLVIFAGGCKSYYEGLMEAGANFASSPSRILLHVNDPVLLAYKISTTSVKEYLDVDTVVEITSVGINGIGGIETRGQCREIKPLY